MGQLKSQSSYILVGRDQGLASHSCTQTLETGTRVSLWSKEGMT